MSRLKVGVCCVHVSVTAVTVMCDISCCGVTLEQSSCCTATGVRMPRLNRHDGGVSVCLERTVHIDVIHVTAVEVQLSAVDCSESCGPAVCVRWREWLATFDMICKQSTRL